MDPIEILKALEAKLKAFMDKQEAELKALKGDSAEAGKKGAERAGELEADLVKVKSAVEQLRSGVEAYTKQMTGLSAQRADDSDPEYKGFWPSGRKAAKFGHWALATLHPKAEVRRAGAEQVVKDGLTLLTHKGQPADPDAFVKAMAEGSDAAGGYLVPEEFVPTLIRHVEQYGVARARLRKVPMSSDRQSWPVHTGHFTVYYPDEGVAPTASDLTFGRVTLTAKKWAVLTYFSEELEEDAAIALGELIGLEVALALAHAEDLNAFMGDGTSTYCGIVGVMNSANVAVVTMDSGKDTFVELSYGNLVDLKYAVPTWVRQMPDCAYFMHPELAGICEKMVDATGGQPLFQRPTEGFPLRIGGHPVVEVLTMPDSGDTAAAKKFIAFGSLMAWGMLGQRRGMTIQRSTEVKWLEGQVAIKCVPRQDIQEAVGEAMAVLKTHA